MKMTKERGRSEPATKEAGVAWEGRKTDLSIGREERVEGCAALHSR